MPLDALAAKALFAIVLSNTQGPEQLKPQLPLHVLDRGDSWLVTGTPYTDNELQSRYCMCHMFFQKKTAEVTGITCHARMIPSKDVDWSMYMTPEQYQRVFGPPTIFEPDGILDIWFAVYGGMVNTPAAAADYAAVVMRTRPAFATIVSSDLKASERDKVWHITYARGNAGDLLTISRRTGEVLSGDL